jgi:hypothetical protein
MIFLKLTICDIEDKDNDGEYVYIWTKNIAFYNKQPYTEVFTDTGNLKVSETSYEIEKIIDQQTGGY